MLAERLLVLRGEARLSRRELAERADVSHAYIGMLERGEIANPGGPRLDRVARALGWADYHAMLSSTETVAPRPDAEREALDHDRRTWEARQEALLEERLAELRGLFLEARADYAAMLRIMQAVLDRERTGRAGGPPPASARP